MRLPGPDQRASRSVRDRRRTIRRAVPVAARGRDRTTRLVAAEDGQAAVELVALLPVIAVLLAGVWQATLAGHAVWAANAAARAAARAHAVGADPRAAARSHLPRSLERGLRVTAERGGDVRVTVRIPALPGLPSPGRADAGAHFEPQT
jgi:Flp pilus assembly protein TadG